jgi:hypothetical protein
LYLAIENALAVTGFKESLGRKFANSYSTESFKEWRSFKTIEE